PLLETVTEPCLNSADEAIAFLEALRSIFLYCDTSYARSDRGQIRCDVNVSLMREGDKELGTKVEMKNINSFSSVREAIICEVERQTEILNSGGKVLQETRRYDENAKTTFMMRSKEDAIDYKYFTDPNLPPIKISREWCEEIKNEIPRLQYERSTMYINDYNISSKDAYTIVKEMEISDYYEECIKLGGDPILVCNWLTGSLIGNMNKMGITIKELKFTPSMLVELIKLINDGKISGKQAKEVLEKSMESGKKPSELVSEMGLSQITDESEIRNIILEVINENSHLVDDYKAGKRVFDYFIGQIMKKTKGRANPVITSRILKGELDKQ
ncbi:MAG: Asp-tRNA(Asn)/Glu-tRNA(Gln) amidotransferase subunit GatB, partial [Bacilli bacterium]|nr:Asp-tRNA(Asn)/Glu-tRNA(Gln) amidotransferase subunit GatB [Bacilli bacterium]